MQQARIVNGTVVEVAPSHAQFHKDLGFVPVPDWVKQGHVYSNNTFSEPRPPEAKAALLSHARNRRVFHEIGTAKEPKEISVQGIPIRTDWDTQLRLLQLYIYMSHNPNVQLVQWKLGNGNFQTLRIDQITKIMTAVTAHSQACYNAESKCVLLINASPPQITEMSQIDAIFAEVES